MLGHDNASRGREPGQRDPGGPATIGAPEAIVPGRSGECHRHVASVSDEYEPNKRREPPASLLPILGITPSYERGEFSNSARGGGGIAVGRNLLVWIVVVPFKQNQGNATDNSPKAAAVGMCTHSDLAYGSPALTQKAGECVRKLLGNGLRFGKAVSIR
jgi:hypothetical protein